MPTYAEYMDAIKHTKIRLKVCSKYHPFLIMKGLKSMKGVEDYIQILNIINRVGVPYWHKINVDGETTPQDMFEKQMHFDFQLHTIPKTPKKKKKTSK